MVSDENKALIPQRVGLFVFLVISITAIYWRVFKYPFIQDDWYIIDSIRSLGSAGYLAHIFSVTENLFYRPVGQTYFLIVYNLSGLNPFGFHLLSLLIHLSTALIIVFITKYLADDRLIAWATGFLYAIAITIHMDSMLWMVGFYDIGGAFFFFLSFFFFIRNKITLSVPTYALSLFTKESTVILLPILFIYQFQKDNDYTKLFSKLRSDAKKLSKHIVVLVIYLMIKMPSLGVVPTNVENPYRIQFVGSHITDNMVAFFKWSIEGLNPYFELPWGGIGIVVGCIVLFFIIHYKSKIEKSKSILFIGWMLLGLLPVIFLTNHFFRYYLTYSLPAFIIFILFGLRGLVLQVFKKQSAIVFLYSIFILTSVISSTIYFGTLDRLGLNVPTIQGSGNLIRKGSVVYLVKNFLDKEYPVLPQHVSLVFNWVPTIAFGKSIGPRIWYNDSTIHVYEVLTVRRGSAGMEVQLWREGEDGEQPQVDPKNTILIKYHGDYIRTTNLNDFLQGAPEK